MGGAGQGGMYQSNRKGFKPKKKKKVVVPTEHTERW